MSHVNKVKQSVIKVYMMLAIIAIGTLPICTDVIAGEKNSADGKVLNGVYAAYMPLQKALAADDFEKAKKEFAKLETAVSKVSGISEANKDAWEKMSKTIQAANKTGKTAKNVAAAREEFKKVSDALIEALSSIGHTNDKPYYKVHCSMAFNNKGGSWIQDDKKVNNPYWGSKMLRCGSVKETYNKS